MENAVITYAAQILPNGLKVRPDTESVIEQLLQGASVFIENKSDYPTLFRAFQRVARKKKIRDKKIARAQVNTSKWQLLLLPKKSKGRPAAPPEAGFLLKYGRYKEWAQELCLGDCFALPGKAEAQKLMRAWRAHTPASKRVGKRLVCLPGADGGWCVSVIKKGETRLDAQMQVADFLAAIIGKPPLTQEFKDLR